MKAFIKDMTIQSLASKISLALEKVPGAAFMFVDQTKDRLQVIKSLGGQRPYCCAKFFADGNDVFGVFLEEDMLSPIFEQTGVASLAA